MARRKAKAHEPVTDYMEPDDEHELDVDLEDEVIVEEPKVLPPQPLPMQAALTCKHPRFRAIRDKQPWVWRCTICGHEWPILKTAGR